jgi:hypothetical protein
VTWCPWAMRLRATVWPMPSEEPVMKMRPIARWFVLAGVWSVEVRQSVKLEVDGKERRRWGICN